MYDNFENLQKKARKYYLKRRVIQTLLVSAVLLVFVIVYIFAIEGFEHKKEISKPLEIKKEVSKVIKKETPKVIPKVIPKIEPIKVVKELPKEQEKIIQDVAYKLHSNFENIEKLTQFAKEPIPKTVKQETNKQTNQEVKQKTPKISTSAPEKESESKLHVEKPVQIVVNRLDSISKMIRFYEKENRYSLAIEIAQKYYDIQDYKNSLLWSKKANLLNKSDYKAWLLYAKSEYNQNNRSKAIKILQLYLRDSTSQEVQSQLLTWTKGE